jgi:hypothetical protein
MRSVLHSSLQVAEKRPSASFPLPAGRSFVVAAYLQVRLWPAHRLAGVARSRSLFVATPLSVSRELPRTGFRYAQLASACLREAASAEAGTFLSNLEQITFSANCWAPKDFVRQDSASRCVKKEALRSQALVREAHTQTSSPETLVPGGKVPSLL